MALTKSIKGTTMVAPLLTGEVNSLSVSSQAANPVLVGSSSLEDPLVLSDEEDEVLS